MITVLSELLEFANSSIATIPVLVGSGVTLASVALTNRWTDDRTKNEALRKSLTNLHDAIAAFHMEVQRAVESRRDPAIAPDNIAVNVATVRLTMALVVVGDEQLSHRVATLRDALVEAGTTPGYVESRAKMDEALKLLKPAMYRWAELFHGTDVVRYN